MARGSWTFDSAASMAGKRIATFKGSYPETWAREHVPTATIIPIDGTSTELDDTLRSKQADVIVGFYSRQKAVARTGSGDVAYRNALLEPMQSAFAVRKQCEELRQAVDGTLEALWTDGSLNTGDRAGSAWRLLPRARDARRAS